MSKANLLIETMETQEPDLIPGPAYAVNPVELPRFFKLTYKERGKLNERNFAFNGNLQAARERARVHCVIMGIHFVLCVPLIVDLDIIEKERENGNAA